MRYLAYCRRSSDREDRQTLSIEAQIRELKEFAERNSLDVVEYLEESQSAYKPKRPVFNQMLDRLERSEADAVLVWHTSRLARNPMDGGRLIYMMDEGHIKEIRTPSRAFFNSGNDKFFLALELGMAKKSSDDTSDFVRRDTRSKLLKGEWVGMAPIGYLNIDAESKIAGKFYDHEKQTLLLQSGHSLRRIEQDPIVAPLMRRFFDWYLTESHTLAEAATFINGLGIKSSRFKGRFTTSMVERILHNPFYTGLMRYEGERFKGVHEPIITLDEFDRIQIIMSGRTHPKLVKQEFVYRGLITCGECGCAIVGIRKVKPSGKEYEYYTCSKRRGACSQRPLKPHDIDQQVADRLKDVYIDERVWELCKKLLKLHYSQQVDDQLKFREQWGRDLKAVEKKLANLIEAHISEVIDRDTYVMKKNELLSEKTHLEQKLHESGDTTRHWLLETERFFDKAHLAYTRFSDPTVDIVEKKHVLQDIGWNLKLLDGKLEWEYKKPFDILAERREAVRTVGTRKLRRGQKKVASAIAEATFWRTGRDSNPRSSP